MNVGTDKALLDKMLKAKGIAIANGRGLVRAFHNLSNEDANDYRGSGILITRLANQKGFTDRDKPFGAKLFMEATGSRKPPVWVTKAACAYAVDEGYIPIGYGECHALAWFWLDINGPFKSKEDAWSSLPDYLRNRTMRPLVDKFLPYFLEYNKVG